MITPQLKETILAVAEFSAEEMEFIGQCFISREFRPKEHILLQGNKSKEIYFIVSGLVRAYHIKKAKEVTTYLSGDGDFISSYAAFITQTPSLEFIQCIEATHTLSISYDRMQELYDRIPGWQLVGRVLTERNFLCMAKRVLELHSSSAKEKYLDFIQHAPAKVAQRTPLIYVASFLGIVPESLSRIRREITSKNS